ncbi:hypothetical protein [Lentzea sp. NEAU-D7]|uniref:hypothetical protein n=1 Tax=Lentzea sp. NEAU-D7 TaxID=2994667 RepID=UPI003A4C7021
MAASGYQSNPGVIMPYRKPREGQSPLPQWKEDLNTVHKSVGARVEHAPAHMKSWNIRATAAANATTSGTPPETLPTCATWP